MRLKFKIALSIVGLLLLGLTIALAAAYYASQQAPAFYERATQLDQQRARETSKEMIQQSASLIEDVRRRGQWEAVFTAEQINGWLAVDLVENHSEILSPEIEAPRVAIAPRTATIACLYKGSGLDTVLSLEVELALLEENEVAVRFRRAWAGAVPLPMARVLESVRDTAQHLEWPIEWRQVDGDPVALITVPPVRQERGHSVSVKLDTLELREGELYVAGQSRQLD